MKITKRMINLNQLWRLTIKEWYSLISDPILILLIIYTFSIAVYVIAHGIDISISDASVAIVDEDNSQLSASISDALLPPYFKTPIRISADQIKPMLDNGSIVFAVEIPAGLERSLLNNEDSEIMIHVDATAMSQAGNGTIYIQTIIQNALNTQKVILSANQSSSINIISRAYFNPNLDSIWFSSVMQVANAITMLAVILTGAAVLREREHGTLEHLLVMPIGSSEIMLSKIIANASVIIISALLSIKIMVEWVLDVPIQGSITLYTVCTICYLFSVTSLGVMLSTYTRSMAQFGLLMLPIIVLMYVLSGAITPVESMPDWLQNAILISPTTHFVRISQAILYRAAGLDIVWPNIIMLLIIGAVFYLIALRRFRRTVITNG
jgi:ABC-2 type transport system permease protein